MPKYLFYPFVLSIWAEILGRSVAILLWVWNISAYKEDMWGYWKPCLKRCWACFMFPLYYLLISCRNLSPTETTSLWGKTCQVKSWVRWNSTGPKTWPLLLITQNMKEEGSYALSPILSIFSYMRIGWFFKIDFLIIFTVFILLTSEQSNKQDTNKENHILHNICYLLCLYIAYYSSQNMYALASWNLCLYSEPVHMPEADSSTQALLIIALEHWSLSKVER